MSSPSATSSNISASKTSKVTPTLSVDDSDFNKSSEQNYSAKITAMAERRVQRGMELQQQLAQAQEELKKTKNQMVGIEKEKSFALDELQEMKKVAEDAKLRIKEAILAQKRAEERWEMEKMYVNQLEQATIESAEKRDQAWQLELEANQRQHAIDIEALTAATEELRHLKQELSMAIQARDKALKFAEVARVQANLNGRLGSSGVSCLVSTDLRDRDEELNTKGINNMALQKSSSVESLNLKTDNTKGIKTKLVEGEKLKLEVKEARESESRALILSSQSRARVEKHEHELNKQNKFEAKTFGSLHPQPNTLLEAPKLETTSIHESNISMDVSGDQSCISHNLSQDNHVEHGTDESLNVELRKEKKGLIHSQEGKELVLLNPSHFAKEMGVLRNQLMLATKAEENSMKAMDDLAVTFKEVTTEANQLKAKLSSTEAELESSRMEVEYMNLMLKNTGEKYQILLDEAMKEIDKLTQTSERLKLEADESLAAWNGKELCFVQCIKESELEISREKEENQRLMESLREAEEASKMAKQENGRLRDILKQAINEATVANEAAEIARTENSQLKDSLSDMASELERLKISEASSLESINELKSLLSKNGSSNKALVSKDLNRTNSNVKESMKLANLPSELLKELLTKPHTPTMNIEIPGYPNGGQKASGDLDTLEGSTFTVGSSQLENMSVSNKLPLHRKAHSMVLMADRENAYPDDFSLEETHFVDIDNQRSSAVRQSKKKAMLQRFGDLLKKRSNK